ncbi:MAG TPA: M56 family metallopeptidase [Candidatus Limivicinus faecipullorum]|nr:M56 family metallopeptidase [Candidatus Limivicinus faecipullorum]
MSFFESPLFFRLFVGLFLSALVAWGYRRSRRYEEGAPASIAYGDAPAGHKYTYVYLNPLYLPIALGVYLLLILVLGLCNLWGMTVIFLGAVLTINIYFILLLLLLPLLRHFFSSRACAVLWLLPTFLFYNPAVPDNLAREALWTLKLPPDFPRLFMAVYLPVALVIFGWKLLANHLFYKRTMASAREITEGREPELFKAELERVSYLKPVKLCYCESISSPLSMGFYDQTRVTLLPRREYTEQELDFIFRHEVCHLQRCDIHTKVFLAFCLAFCWFDPLVWLAVRRAAEDLELACDELVLEGLGREERQAYARLLLMNSGKAPGFTSCLSAAGRTMRYRLKNVVEPRKRRPGTLLLATVMFLCVMGYGLVMFNI